MIKKRTKHGNSLALVLDRGVLDLLEIDADTPPQHQNRWTMSHRDTGSDSSTAEKVPGSVGEGESTIRVGIKKAGGVGDESAVFDLE